MGTQEDVDLAWGLIGIALVILGVLWAIVYGTLWLDRQFGPETPVPRASLTSPAAP